MQMEWEELGVGDLFGVRGLVGNEGFLLEVFEEGLDMEGVLVVDGEVKGGKGKEFGGGLMRVIGCVIVDIG
ncbi:hypothetical protein, partial [Neisseria sicca]|uniref:hypothetical protein n=1 Tax=Neisseria sicca TaxID=490 RepID=UPI001C9A0464